MQLKSLKYICEGKIKILPSNFDDQQQQHIFMSVICCKINKVRGQSLDPDGHGVKVCFRLYILTLK